jgi:Tim10/DDP family zinc finger
MLLIVRTSLFHFVATSKRRKTIMSWFGGGNKKESSSSETGYMDQPHDYVPYSSGSGSSSMPATGGSSSAASELQQFTLGLQQQLLIQQAIGDMSEKAFKVCIAASRDNKLSGKEVACIHSVTNKWIDCNEFLMGRLARKAQQQQQQAGGGGTQF